MKYCLSSRQTEEYLLKADQIKVEYRDRKIIPDLIEKYPDKEIILVFPIIKDDKFDWNEIKNYNVLSKDTLVCCVRTHEDINECKAQEISHFYYGYPIGSFYDLRALKDLGVCYLVIDMPAFFNMSALKNLEVPVRATPNLAYRAYIPHKDGTCGQWIRPEDVGLYDKFISVFEFEDSNITKEQALYRIYAEEGQWPGDFKLLISNLGCENVTNRLIPQDTAVFRLNCGQTCQVNGHCRICYRAFEIANEQKLREYRDILQEKQNTI